MAPPAPPCAAACHHHLRRRVRQPKTKHGVDPWPPRRATMPNPAAGQTEPTPEAAGTRFGPSPEPPTTPLEAAGRRMSHHPPQQTDLGQRTPDPPPAHTLPAQPWWHSPTENPWGIRTPPSRIAPRGTAARQPEASSRRKEASPPPSSAGRASLTGFLQRRRGKQSISNSRAKRRARSKLGF
nr:serine/arginine repetitive matrix protein 1-like [Aegilops tauschii subsp. strangulata]